MAQTCAIGWAPPFNRSPWQGNRRPDTHPGLLSIKNRLAKHKEKRNWENHASLRALPDRRKTAKFRPQFHQNI